MTTNQQNKGRLIAEWDVTECVDNGSIYIHFIGLKEPKHILDRIAQWYILKHSIHPLITKLTTKEYEFTK